MLDVIVKYITANYIEALGVLLSFCYMFFSVRGKIWLWIFGFLSSICYLIVFYQSKFYAMGSLQLYYVAMSIYGSSIVCHSNDMFRGTFLRNKELYRVARSFRRFAYCVALYRRHLVTGT